MGSGAYRVRIPEGDAIHRAANRIRPVLEGQVPDTLRTLHPRFAHDRWEERLAGRAIEGVHAHGKHLLLDFEGGWTIHSHLRMTGRWRVLAPGANGSARGAWLAIDRAGWRVLQLHGPVLRLLHAGRVRLELARLGPDILADEFDAARVLAALRRGDPERTIGDALLDQHLVAGIGNKWKAEGCFAAAVDPWKHVGATTDDELERTLSLTRVLMQASVRDEHPPPAVYRQRRCPRCGGRIRVRGQGDENRMTYWCPSCQG